MLHEDAIGAASPEPLRRELLELIAIVCPDDTVVGALVRWLGLDGEGGMKITRVVTQSGVDRETLQSYFVLLPKRLSFRPPPTPVLDRALEVIDRHLPATLPRLGMALQRARLTSAPFDVRGIVEAADLLGRLTPFIVEPGKPAIATHPHVGGVRKAVELACWLALGGSTFGHVDDVSKKLAKGRHPAVWETLTNDLIEASPDFAWVDAERTRFAQARWVEAVITAVLGRLARDGHASLAELTAVVTNDPLLRRPLSVDDLRGILLRIPGVAVADDRIELTTTRSSDLTVDEEERRHALVEILKARPHATLRELCGERSPNVWLRATTMTELAAAARRAGIRRTAR